MLERSSKTNPCPICGSTKKCSNDLESNRLFCKYVHKSLHPFKLLKRKGVFSIFKNTTKADNIAAYVGSTSRSKSQGQKNQYNFSIEITNREKVIDIDQVLSKLSLVHNHQQDLLERGLNQTQIEHSRFKSVNFNEYVSSSKGHAPGFDAKGKWVMGKGMLVPIQDLYGHYVGYQVKNDNKDYGKYIWARCFENKSANLIRNMSHLNIKESYVLPIQHALFGSKKDKVLYLSEGHLKPVIAAYKHKINVLGASGGQFSSSAVIVAKAIQELNPDKVVWLADSGTELNPDVVRTIAQTAELVNKFANLELQIADWGQLSDKSIGDIDEIDTDDFEIASFISHKMLTVSQTPDEVTNAIADTIFDELSVPDVFGSGYNHLVNRIYKTFNGSLPTKEFNNEPCDGYYFEPHERQEILSLAYHKGYQFVLDASQTGASKSWYSGMLKTDHFRSHDDTAHKIWYFHSRHREPSTPTIDENFVEHPTKNAVMYQSQKVTPFHKVPVLVRDKPKYKTRAVLGNCEFAEEQNALYEAKVNISLCKGCPHFAKCAKEVEPGKYGYRFQVKESLKYDRIRANFYGINPQAVHENDVAVIDEYSQTLDFVETTTITPAHWESNKKKLQSLLGEAFSLLDPVKAIFENKLVLPQFGWNYADFLEAFDRYQFTSLIGFASKAQELEERYNEERAASGSAPTLIWMHKLLQALSGQLPHMSMSFNKNSITIYERNVQTLEKLTAFKTVVFMDATSTRASLARDLQCDESDILLISCKPKAVKNVTINQIVSIGTPGKNRTATQTTGIEIIKDWATEKYGDDVGFIDWKKYTKKGYLAHFIDGRGSNEFQSKKAIVTIGSANMNVTAAKATFESLYGIKIQDSKTAMMFQDYYESLRQSEVEQEIGRLRGSRREEQLDYYSVSTDNLSYLKQRGFTYKVLRGFEIDDRICNNKEKIIMAALKLKERGVLRSTSVRKMSQEFGLQTRMTERYISKFKGGIKAFKEAVLAGVFEEPEILMEAVLKRSKTSQDCFTLLLDMAKLKNEVKAYTSRLDEFGKRVYHAVSSSSIDKKVNSRYNEIKQDFTYKI